MVCMRVGHSNTGLLAVARDVAVRFGSTVVGVAAKQVFTHGAQIRGAGLCEPQQYGPRKFAENAAAAEAEFRKALAGVEKLEWRTQMTFGPVYGHIANEARIADLVVAPIDGHDRFFSPSGQAEIGDLLKNLGRPVLATPPGATGLGFDQALVSWKETKETRRAVADALPLLKAMGRVDVIEIVQPSEVEESRRRLADVGGWLERNGIQAKCSAEVVERARVRPSRGGGRGIADRSRRRGCLQPRPAARMGVRRHARPSVACPSLRSRLALTDTDSRGRPDRMDQSTRQTMPPRQKTWLGAFAHPGFVVVWAASTIALIGIAMYDTASGWLMTTLDLNPFDVSLVHAATNLPMFLFTLPAGALADIVDPRRLILAVSCMIAALVAIFAGLVSLDLATPLLLLLDDFPAQRRLGAEPSGLALHPAEPGAEIRPARSDRRRRGRL